jgi:hypothetical protein
VQGKVIVILLTGLNTRLSLTSFLSLGYALSLVIILENWLERVPRSLYLSADQVVEVHFGMLSLLSE